MVVTSTAKSAPPPPQKKILHIFFSFAPTRAPYVIICHCTAGPPLYCCNLGQRPEKIVSGYPTCNDMGSLQILLVEIGILSLPTSPPPRKFGHKKMKTKVMFILRFRLF